ncbi:hypothetical protein [Cohnella sp. GCM10012308]|uniref:hypothetical protein n=1 Tax=Cohnella sp. GCM10012308 TaxID=3317329 RepID=UPI00360726E3
MGKAVLNQMSKGKIIVFNSFLVHGDRRLNPKELYLYALLQARMSWFLGVTEISVNTIVKFQTIYYDDKRNPASIKKLLQQISQKGVIQISPTEFSLNTVISITFPIREVGYELIDRNTFQLTDDPDEFYVICTLLAFGKKGYTKQKEKWSDVLGYSSPNTGKAVIDNLIEKEIVLWRPGKTNQDSLGHFKTDIGKFYLNNFPLSGTEIAGEFDLHEDKSGQIKEEGDTLKSLPEVKVGQVEVPLLTTSEEIFHQGTSNEYDTVLGFLSSSDIKDRIKTSNVGRQVVNRNGETVYAKIQYDDYALFKIAEEHEIDLGFVKRFKKLPAYNDLWQQYEEEYLQHLSNRRAATEEAGRIIELYEEIQRFNGTPILLYDGNKINSANIPNDFNLNLIFAVAIISNNTVDESSETQSNHSVEEITLDMIFGQGRSFSEEILFQARKALLDQIKGKRASSADLEEIRDMIDQLCQAANTGKRYDEDWEGDEWVYDGVSESNMSKLSRMAENRRNKNV